MNSYVRQQLHPCCFGFDTSMLLTRPVVFDAIMRVRTSTGVRPTDFFGAFYMVRSYIIDPLGQVDLIQYIFHNIESHSKSSMLLLTYFDLAGQHNGHGAGFIEQRYGLGLRDQA